MKPTEISKEVLAAVPAKIALHYCVLPLAIKGSVLKIAMPSDLPRQIKDELKVVLNFNLEFVPSPREEIRDLIARSYGVGAGVIETLTGEEESREEASDFEVIDQDETRDATISTLVNELFLDALKLRASDIHIEPFEKSLRIRYRVDGLLQNARISERIRILAPNLISRIKIMAKLDIGEKRLPQDGRIKIKYEGVRREELGNRKEGIGAGTSVSPNSSLLSPNSSLLSPEELDLRVSVLSSSFGEAIVIRILKPLELLDLTDLGFDEKGIGQIQELLKKPHGVILITGPTGSGKTTTLYACLRELNQTERKIITVEDPVEYKLPGIIQMQVHPKIDFTFAKALRSVLRHDPDVIMIGEIRDQETAEIAIRSALTGHLVFSTLHTNDAPSAVTRLIEMGVEPYLVASALEGVIAQRLVRRTCQSPEHQSCVEALGIRREEIGVRADLSPKSYLLSPLCSACLGTGFHGRIAISEMMVMTEEIRDLVLDGKTGSVIRKAATKNGMTSLYADGMNKVRSLLTSEPEISRITSPLSTP